MAKLLTKSKYLNGLQCHKLLWYALNLPNEIPKPDESTQKIFDQGHEIGELARKCFDGIDLSTEDFIENVRKTKSSLNLGKPIFEAGFMVGKLYSRADILNPISDGWEIIEVKSGANVKEVNIHDISFQKYVYEKAGLRIDRCILMLLNNQYVKEGPIQPQKLFVRRDVTEDVNKAQIGIGDRIEYMLKMINEERPEITIGSHCFSPYDCNLIEKCWESIPDENVFVLSRAGKKSDELIENGISLLKDIPTETKLTQNQKIQVECSITGKPYVNNQKIREFLNRIKEPIHFLDFEAFATAIPIYDGTSPFQQIPFQYSLHIFNGNLEHHEFINIADIDPREAFILSLKNTIIDQGSIIVFDKRFEKTRLEEIAELFPEHKDWIRSVITRIIDLNEPFAKFYYYNPKQLGSSSIKKVLPAMTNRSYDMEISDGNTAASYYLKMIKNSDLALRPKLLEYCKLDSEAMYLIYQELKKR
jgi:hypothetical protein